MHIITITRRDHAASIGIQPLEEEAGLDLSHALTHYSVVPGRGTPEGWVEQVNFEFPALKIDAASRDFVGNYRAAATTELQISDIATGPHLIERSARRTDSGTDLFKISYQIKGTGTIEQGQHQLRFQPGTITLYDAATPYRINFENDMRFIVAMFPKSALRLPPGVAGQLRAQQLDAHDATSKSLGVLFTQLADNLTVLSSASGERLSRVTINLVSSMLTERLDNAIGDGSLSQIRNDALTLIDDNLSDPKLSPSFLASSLFISVRRLHASFEETGTTVTRWIRDRRLVECRRVLLEPLRAADPIREIAVEHGFEDMSLFSRRFREKFGVTPSECREQ